MGAVGRRAGDGVGARRGRRGGDGLLEVGREVEVAQLGGRRVHAAGDGVGWEGAVGECFRRGAREAETGETVVVVVPMAVPAMRGVHEILLVEISISKRARVGV